MDQCKATENFDGDGEPGSASLHDSMVVVTWFTVRIRSITTKSEESFRINRTIEVWRVKPCIRKLLHQMRIITAKMAAIRFSIAAILLSPLVHAFAPPFMGVPKSSQSCSRVWRPYSCAMTLRSDVDAIDRRTLFRVLRDSGMETRRSREIGCHYHFTHLPLPLPRLVL